VTYGHRGEIHTLEVNAVINCTGPNGNFRRISDTLVARLREKGLLIPDALAMGVAVTPTWQLLDQAGQPVPHVWTLGTALKGRLWESIAVPELRQQAQQLAMTLASHYGCASKKVTALEQAATS
jgi:uncharacterized NAD(P)/FAD-binding protein YdhS